MNNIPPAGSEENKWLLRICAVLLSALSFQYNRYQLKLDDTLSELSKTVAEHDKKLGEHSILIKTIDNAEGDLKEAIDNLRTNKLYALKPDGIRIKRKYN